MPKKVLITGAGGFVGSLLCKTLRNLEQIECISTDKNGNFDIKGDLSNLEFVKSLPNVDAVIHCAAVQYHSKNIPFFLRRNFFFKNNVETTKNLILHYSGKETYFINIGSSMMYRPSLQRLKPSEDNFFPNGIYSDSKIQSFKQFTCYKGPVVHLIPGVIAGKSRDGLFLKLNRIIKNLKIAIIGRDAFKISLIHVEDFVNLIVKIIEKQKPPQGIFNASIEPSSVNDWVKEMAIQQKINALEIKLPNYFFSLISLLSFRRIISEEQALLLTSNNMLDTTSTEELDWHTKFNLNDIIKDVISH